VRSSVARYLGLPSIPVPQRTVDGLIEVLLDATEHHDLPMTAERLFSWQAALFPTGYSGLQSIRVGQLRGEEPMQVVSGAIGREQVYFIAPPRAGLDAELTRYLEGVDHPPASIDGLIRTGIAHLWLVTLHPFEDGNGRLARAITDMMLCRDESQPMRLFSLSAQLLREREAYYDILEHTQRGGLDVTAWLAWFLEQIQAAAASAEQTLANTLAKGPLLAPAPDHRPRPVPAQGAQSVTGRGSRRIRRRHEHPQVHEPSQDQPCDGLPGARRPSGEGLSAAHRKRREKQQLRACVVVTA